MTVGDDGDSTVGDDGDSALGDYGDSTLGDDGDASNREAVEAVIQSQADWP